MSAYEINVKSLWNTWKHFMKYLPKPLRNCLVGRMPLQKQNTQLLNPEHVPLVGNCCMQFYVIGSCHIFSLWSIKNQQARSTLVGSLHGLSDYLTHCDTTTASPSFAKFSVLTWAKKNECGVQTQEGNTPLDYKISQVYMAVRTFVVRVYGPWDKTT